MDDDGCDVTLEQTWDALGGNGVYNSYAGIQIDPYKGDMLKAQDHTTGGRGMTALVIDLVRALRDRDYQGEICAELEGFSDDDLRHAAADELERFYSADKEKRLPPYQSVAFLAGT